MPWRKKRCKQCGITDVPISSHHLCQECAIENVKSNAHQIMNRSGPTYEKYKAGVLKFLAESIEKNSKDLSDKGGMNEGK